MGRTMAKLVIEVDGTPVTTVKDLETGRYRKAIIVPLFAVADWLVDNWWYLFHEPAGIKNQKEYFSERHDLAFAGNGFLLPRLSFAPYSDQIHVVAERSAPKHGTISFVESIDAYIDRKELQGEFHKLVEAVIARIRKSNVESTDTYGMSVTWDAIHDLDGKELEFCHAAALCGIDPFDVDDRVAAEITHFWKRIDPSIREDALAVADTHSLRELGDWIESAVGQISSNAPGSFWGELRDGMPPVRNQRRPWTQGYELAQTVRKELGITDGPFEFKSAGESAVSYSEREFAGRHIDGVVAAAYPACVAVPQRYESNKRFLQARALGDFLIRDSSQLGILNSLNNKRQAFTRAFAAELLAPAEALKSRFDGFPSDEEIERLSEDFNVSSMVITHQLENYESQMA